MPQGAEPPLEAVRDDPAPALEGSAAHIQLTTQEWQGPLPPPATLRAFEDVHPGAASLIIAQFMAEAEHRRKQEDREARLRVRETHIGQASAIIFALAALGVALYAAHVQAQWIGSIVGGGIIVSGITALRGGRKP